MPNDNDKTSISRDGEFIIRFQQEDGSWFSELTTNKAFDKFYINAEGYEWLEGAFTQEQTPSRQEIIDIIREAIHGSIPYITRLNAFMITPESWTKLAVIVDPELENVFKAIDNLMTNTNRTQNDSQN